MMKSFRFHAAKVCAAKEMCMGESGERTARGVQGGK